MFTKAKIENELRLLGIELPRIIFYDSTDSTNTRAVEYARTPFKHDKTTPTVFIANGQSAGRGRRGRSFVSKRGTGIYLSLLTRPDNRGAEVTKCTAYAAVALCRAIESLCDCHIGIKWVNDLYIGDKKLAGILTETEMTDNGKMSYLVIGMGINVYKNAISDEISDIATSLEHHTSTLPDRSKLAAAIIRELLYPGEDFFEEYRKRSIAIGRDVTVVKLSEQYNAKVIDLDTDFSLIVERENGRQEKLFTGEISLKI